MNFATLHAYINEGKARREFKYKRVYAIYLFKRQHLRERSYSFGIGHRRAQAK